VALIQWAEALWQKVSGTRMVTPEEIEGALHLPVLAIIPHIERRKGLLPTQGPIMRRIDLEGRWRSRLLIHFPENVAASATYSNLAKELYARSLSSRQKVWLFAGSVAGEGTSLTIMNLAIAAQRLGVKTLIVEGHTRSPRISSVLRLDLEPGLTGCLNRSIGANHAIQKSSLAAVDVLSAGRPVAYPENLWGTPIFHRLLAEIRSLYDLVLFEGPPILLYSDVPVIADKVDGVVLIHQFGRSSPQRVEKVLAKLGDRQNHVLGIILNDVPVGVESGHVGLH
jgi:capsular exopolysaccharide synthesis family protein